MIGRRLLLLGGGALALAGCTAETVDWLPWTSPSPLPIEVTDRVVERVATTAALARHLTSHAEEWKLTERRTATLHWFAKATDEHGAVLSSADPARRQTSTGAQPSVAAPTQKTAAATTSSLVSRLTALAGAHTAAARSANGPAALLWASLAAFSSTMAGVLPTGVAALGDDGTALTPDLTGTSTATILALTEQAAYSYEMSLAAPALSGAQGAALRTRLDAWRALRAAVLVAAPSVTPSPPPIGYDVRPARNWAAARQLASATEGAALPLLGAWLAGTASVTERRLGVAALGASNTALVRFGGSALRWPGWPG